MLPSVRSIKAHHTRCEDSDYATCHSYVLNVPNTTNVELRNCTLGPKMLYKFLETLRALEAFSWHGSDELADNDDFLDFLDVGWVCTCLISNVRSSLLSLSLLTHHPQGPCMGDVTSFHKLRYFEVSDTAGTQSYPTSSCYKRPCMLT